MSVRITKLRNPLKKPLSKVQGQQSSALAHSLALRMAGLQLKALTTQYHIAGTDRFGLKLELSRRLNEEEE
jgi:hypothetical protein